MDEYSRRISTPGNARDCESPRDEEEEEGLDDSRTQDAAVVSAPPQPPPMLSARLPFIFAAATRSDFDAGRFVAAAAAATVAMQVAGDAITLP